jgi:hypothetical protein
MNPSARPQTSRNRDRAVASLQSITARTAVAATIATIGFGGLAAYTYTGTTDGASTIDSNAAGATTDGSTTNTTTGAAATAPTPAGLQAVAAPTATKRPRARVTSGGSGN